MWHWSRSFSRVLQISPTIIIPPLLHTLTALPDVQMSLPSSTLSYPWFQVTGFITDPKLGWSRCKGSLVVQETVINGNGEKGGEDKSS
jgi:hypothetical protein